MKKPFPEKDNDAFSARYASLNPEQRRAVDTLEGPVMVIAGPGTGKTEVLTMRIANILRQGGAGRPRPERILALTFTEAGAATMRSRLADLVGEDAYRVEISTFHGFANRVIQEYPDHFPSIIGAASITEIDQVDILRRIIDALPLTDLRPFGERYYHLRAILGAINELKQQSVPPDAFRAIAHDAKQEFYANPDLINKSGKFEGRMKGKYAGEAKRVLRNIELASVYAEYQKALAAGHQYDYSDMIMRVAQAVEHDAVLRQILQEAYDYLLVDEHQDTNDAQNRVVELIADGRERPNLFIVGDEHQAIYRFQGASSENFHYFRTRYEDVAVITLKENYRSTQAILDAAHGVSPREVPLVANMKHAAPAGGAQRAEPVHYAALASPDAALYFIAAKAKELVGSGVPAKEIAVLYRNNKDAAGIARMFERLGVPFVIESNQDVLGDEEVRKLIRILRAVQHFGADIWLAEALHVDFLGIAPIDVYRLSSHAFRNRRRMYEAMQDAGALDAAGVSAAGKESFAQLFADLSRWKRAAKNKGAAEAFAMVAYESGFVAALLRHPSATEKLAKLHALFDVLKSLVERRRNYTLDDFFAYIDLMEEHDLAIRGRDAAHLPGRIRLMTAHGAKGLEFDHVFIADATERKWGAKRHGDSIRLPAGVYRGAADMPGGGGEEGADDDDERNLFYVALTRARKTVFLVTATGDRDGRPTLPTKFIAAIKRVGGVIDEYGAAAYEEEYAERRNEIELAPPPAPVPELEDKEFLNGIFRAEGLSVTALNNYLECPWAYFYRNLVRIPEAPNKHLSFGNAVHAALKAHFDARADGEDSGAAALVARFEGALAREPLAESEYEEALEKGRRALSRFYDEYHASWASASPGGRPQNEVKVDGVTLADGTPLNGKIDRMEFPAEPGKGGGARDRVRVLDYKTGKPKSRNEIEGRTKASDGDYKRQLVFYKLLLGKEGKYEMEEGVIQFIEPDEQGIMHREAFAVASAEVAALEAQAMAVAREIIDLSFWNKGCHKPDCRYCALRKEMQRR